MNDISVGIMMHPAREHFKPYLLEKLKDFDVRIAIDCGKGIWDTSRRAWLSYDKNAKYHIVIQDDAIIGNRFRERIECEIKRYPDIAYGLYFGRRRIYSKSVKEWKKNGGVIRYWLGWGLATCIPTKIIDDFISYGDGLTKYDNHDDTKLAKYLKKIGMPIWYPLPSLVDHRAERSLVNDNVKLNRKAFYFVGE